MRYFVMLAVCFVVGVLGAMSQEGVSARTAPHPTATLSATPVAMTMTRAPEAPMAAPTAEIKPTPKKAVATKVSPKPKPTAKPEPPPSSEETRKWRLRLFERRSDDYPDDDNPTMEPGPRGRLR